MRSPLPTELARKKRKKMMLASAGLFALALASFLIALAASSGKKERAVGPPRDAQPAVVHVDAALPIAEPPLDAAVQQTLAIDAAPPVGASSPNSSVLLPPHAATVIASTKLNPHTQPFRRRMELFS